MSDRISEKVCLKGNANTIFETGLFKNEDEGEASTIICDPLRLDKDDEECQNQRILNLVPELTSEIKSEPYEIELGEPFLQNYAYEIKSPHLGEEFTYQTKVNYQGNSNTTSIIFDRDWKLYPDTQVKVMLVKLSSKFLLKLELETKFKRSLSSARKEHLKSQKEIQKLPRKREVVKKQKKNDTLIKSDRKPYKCRLCMKVFANLTYLQQTHYKLDHSNERPHRCPYSNCGKEFAVKATLVEHVRIHADKPYGCRICKKRFTIELKLQTHLQTHESFGERFICGICKIPLPTASKLEKHEKWHNERYRPFECNICQMRFPDSHRLRKHIRIHTGEKPYECSFCKKRFTESNNLIRHLRSHTGEKPHICNICGKGFLEVRNLRRHLDARGVQKEFICSVSANGNQCKKVYCLKVDLKTHMTKDHGGFTCNICQHKSRNSSELKRHVQSRREIHNCVAEGCKLKFCHACTLSTHVRKYHPHLTNQLKMKSKVTETTDSIKI